MPLEVAKEFIDLLLRNELSTQFYMNTREIGSVILDFIGGEPLLEIELID
jgi:sulfatase maturation enzyme AslB (radical SAM superfamily)